MKKHWLGCCLLVGSLYNHANGSDSEYIYDPAIEQVFYQSIITQVDSMAVATRVARLSHLFMGSASS